VVCDCPDHAWQRIGTKLFVASRFCCVPDARGHLYLVGTVIANANTVSPVFVQYLHCFCSLPQVIIGSFASLIATLDKAAAMKQEYFNRCAGEASVSVLARA
jgi:hypothetical protein